MLTTGKQEKESFSFVKMFCFDGLYDTCLQWLNRTGYFVPINGIPGCPCCFGCTSRFIGIHLRFPHWKSYCKFLVKEHFNRSGHIRCITQRHWLSLSFFYPHRIVLSLRRAYPGCPGNSTGLPSSAYITNRVRFCPFAGGIAIHVTETAKPVIYTPYLLPIAYHRLSLFSRHGIYRQFTFVNHTGQA